MRICPACGSAEPPDSRFCSRCGAPLHESGGRERRAVVSIVFCDLEGSTALAERLDPEVLRGVLARYFASCADALRAHGGQIEKYIGDAVMCVFGLPIAHEDDALRAVRGALDLLAAIETLNGDLALELGIELRVRVGVTTGEVVAGDDSRGQVLVTGGTVSTAARLEQAAPAGGILIDELTHRLVAGRVRTEPVPAIVAKGKALPLAAWRVLGVSGVASPEARRTPLIGRGEELGALRAAFARVDSEQHCGHVLVAGEAGIGKSRLVAEFTSSVAAATLTGACASYGRGNTYRPLRDVIEAAAPLLTRGELSALLRSQPDADSIASRLLRLIGHEDGPVTREEAFSSVASLFASLASDEGLILVFEDLQWAEETFLELLRFLVETLDARVLIVGTAREELLIDHAAPTPHVIALERLTDTAAERFIAEAGGASGVDTGDLIARAGGNPLFLEQLLAWRSEGAEGVPPDVSSLLAARLDLLSAEERVVIEAAAVVGRDFLAAAVTRLVANDSDADVARALDRLQARRLVSPGPSSASAGPTGLSGIFAGLRAHFVHALVFDAVLSSTPKARRATLHERFAVELRERTGYDAAVVGYHLEQAALLRKELRRHDSLALAVDAVAHLQQAGREALAHGDAPAASVFLSRARELLSA